MRDRPIPAAGQWLLALAAAVLLLAGAAALGPDAAQAPVLARRKAPWQQASAAPVTLAAATDLHYLDPSLTDGGLFYRLATRNADGKVMDEISALTDAFADEIIARHPAALLLTGDLTFNGALASHRGLAARLRRITAAGVPVFVLPGNHDLDNANAFCYVGGNALAVPALRRDQFAALYAGFGYAQASSRDFASLSYTAELAPGLRLLAIDVNGTATPGALAPATLRWAERQLRQAQADGVRVLAASHQNLLAHSFLRDGYLIAGGAPLLALYECCGVAVNLSGHLHLQHIGRSAGGLTEILTSSLAIPPNQYGLLRIGGGALRYHTVPVDVAGWAVARGSTDPNLLNFAAWAHGFFWTSSWQQARRELGGGAADGDRLAAYFADLNCAYFAGRPDTVTPDPAMAARWAARSPRRGAYLAAIAADRTDQTQAVIAFPAA